MYCLDSLAVVPGLFPGWPPMGLPPVHVGQPQPPAAAAAAPTPVAPATAVPPSTPSAAGNLQQDANQAQVVKDTHVLLLQKFSLIIHFISLLIDVYLNR